MNIGKPVKTYTVEPLEEPCPQQPVIQPDPIVTVPEEEPVTVEP